MLLSTILISTMMSVNAAACETPSVYESSTIETVSLEQNVVLRKTQKLRAYDGREIYFYSSGKCEGFDGDRLQFSTRYYIQNNEVRLLDENGNTLYKGTITWETTNQIIRKVEIAGTTYWAQ